MSKKIKSIEDLLRKISRTHSNDRGKEVVRIRQGEKVEVFICGKVKRKLFSYRKEARVSRKTFEEAEKNGYLTSYWLTIKHFSGKEIAISYLVISQWGITALSSFKVK